MKKLSMAALTATLLASCLPFVGSDGSAYIAYSWAVDPITFYTEDPAFADNAYIYNGVYEDAQVGTPLVAGAKVSATITRHGRGPKLTVYKFKRRKNYRRKQGHRQAFTEVKIEAITG